MEAASLVCVRCMPRLPGRVGRLMRLPTLLAVAALSGCTLIPDEPPSEPVAEPAPPQPAPPPAAPVVRIPDSAPKEPEQRVAIIVSSQLPAYVDVAESLASQLPDDAYITHVLAGDEMPADVSELSALLSEDLEAVVAVGLPAALFAAEHVAAPLIFCQVLNYSDHPELEQAAAGVSMLAAFDEQLAFWKALDATLESVGTIVGPGHEQLIAQSRDAAAAQGITLTARVSDSDRETVYQFKRLSAEVDGFWLIPDNRILSVSAIEELMSYAAQRRLPVVVSTPELLRFGALMSLKPSPVHVADSVLSVLSSLQQFITSGFEIVSPRQFDVDFNDSVAARLGIGNE